MTKALPENQEEMLEIKGIGASFVEKYANRFISVIKQFKFDEQMKSVGDLFIQRFVLVFVFIYKIYYSIIIRKDA